MIAKEDTQSRSFSDTEIQSQLKEVYDEVDNDSSFYDLLDRFAVAIRELDKALGRGAM